MDTLQASAPTDENASAVQNADKSEKPEATPEKLEAMVTPEQVLSASVARRRRTLSKKHLNRTRDVTPGRDAAAQETTSDEDVREKRPKTPERRRRKSSRIASASTERTEPIKTIPTRDEKEIKNDETNDTTTTTTVAVPFHKEQSETKEIVEKRKDSLINITQNEVTALFNKAKRTLLSGRTRHKKLDKSTTKRSQSVPTQFTETDLIEGLRKAHLLDGDNGAVPKRYKHSDSSEISSTFEEKFKPKPYRPVVQQFMAKKKVQRQTSSKVIEILDPKTKKVIGKITKGPPPPPMKFFGFLMIPRYVGIRDMFRIYRSFKLEQRRECSRIAKLRNRCFCDLLIILIFCGLGAIIFKFVEGTFENFYKCGVKRVKRDFIDMLWYRSHNLREDEWKSLARNKLRSFEEELHVAHEAGMHSYSGQKSWSFLNGIIYCISLITTIGYGHMVPETITGKAITIVYAIIGIPLFLIALTDFGKLFTRCIKFLWSYVRRVYYTGSCRTVRKTAHVEDILQGAQIMYEIATLRRPSMFANIDPASLEEDPENPKTKDGTALNSAGIGSDTPTTPAPSNFEIDDEFNLPISVAIFILVLYIFLGAVMYWTLEEKWDFFASFYFVFISMSTIGFGDYVPRHPVCMIASIVYLVFGLALMSMCINVVQVKLSDTFKDASQKLGATIGLGVEEEEEEDMDGGDGSTTAATPVPLEVPAVHVTDEKENEAKDKDKDKKNGKNGKKEKKSSMKVKTKDEKKEKDELDVDDMDMDKPRSPKVKF